MHIIAAIQAYPSNVKLTTQIAAMAIFGVVFSIVLVAGATFIALSAGTNEVAHRQQLGDLRVASTIFASRVSGTELQWDESGEVAALLVWGPPKFDLIEAVGKATGQIAGVYVFDDRRSSLVTDATTLPSEEGEGSSGSVLGPKSPELGELLQGRTFFTEDVRGGVEVYSAYVPILNHSNALVGALFVGVRKAEISAIVLGAIRTPLTVSLVALLVCTIMILVMSRVLTKPVPRLSETMTRIAEGNHDAIIPFLNRQNEIGSMARAIEVFSENGRKVSELAEQARAGEQARHLDRRAMMSSLQSSFGQVVQAAASGDFSGRVVSDFSDAELNALAESVNTLVVTVERGLTETGSILGALANTDLTQRVRGSYGGAFSKLKDDTNHVAEKLTEIVGRLRQTSRSLRTATGELLSGANDLSERTTKQAATIEETSAAMEQLAATVLQSAQHAEEASANAALATTTAEEGGEVMQQATQAMVRITGSSGQISTIIGMIDDIAFQTNLLALNASVEAARAGDAGKGFAVVAIEVRRLAQSAAQASADVKHLVERSAEDITSGTKLVASAASKLGIIVDAIKHSSTILSSIAAQSREQALAIEHVSAAVRTMDEMTQHNAALVEQTNAAIEQTEAQAIELDGIVDVFRIGQIDGSAPEGPVRSAPLLAVVGGNAAISADWDE